MSTTADLVIRNGTIVSPDAAIVGSIAIKDGRILAVGADEAMPPARETLRRHRPACPARRHRRARAFPRSRLSAQGRLGERHGGGGFRRRHHRVRHAEHHSADRHRRSRSPPSTRLPPARPTSISASTACSARTPSSMSRRWSKAASSASSSIWAIRSARSPRPPPARCWKLSRWWRRPASAFRCTPKPIRSWSAARSG